VKIFGIDPGSERTGYGCLSTDGGRHRLIVCGFVAAPVHTSFPDRLLVIHARLAALLAEHRPDCVAIENIFHAKNVRSALKLGHARGVALLAASQAGVPVAEYSPAEIKRAVVGFGRAEKRQVGGMVKILLGLEDVPSPHDVADAIAVAICHVHSSTGAVADAVRRQAPPMGMRSWRHYQPDPSSVSRGTEWSAAKRRRRARSERAGDPASPK
jgi:crossover junction endodeoxyribonuclease RuvC